MLGKKLKINSFAKNVLKLGVATLFSQLIGFLVLPFLSRLYSPEDFGSLGVFTAITSLLAVIAGFKYENAIVLSVDEKEAKNLYVLSLSSTIFLSAISYLFFLTTGSQFLKDLGYRINSFPLYFISLYVFSFGVSQLNKQYFNYKSQFSIISINQIIGRISSVVPKIIFGVFKLGGTGLIIGELLNLMSQVLFSSNKIKLDKAKVNKNSLLKTAKKYIKFPKYELPMDFVNTLAQKVPIAIMVFYFGVNFVGLYVFCNTIPRQLINLTSQNIGGVYYRKIANQTLIFQKEKTQKLLEKLFLIGVFPFMVLTFFSEDIYKFIFSEKWQEAGFYVQILSPSFFVLFLNKPISNSLFRIFGKQNISLYINLIYALLTIVIVFLSGYFNNEIFAIWGISGINFLIWSWILLFLIYKLEISLKNISRSLIKYLLLSVIALSTSLVIKYFLPEKTLLILGSIIVSVLFYLILLLSFDKNKIQNILK